MPVLNQLVSALPSLARTVTVSKEIKSGGHRGCIIVVEVTAGSTPLLTPSVEVKDPGGDFEKHWDADAAIAATGTFIYLIYPGVVTAASGGAPFQGTEVANLPLPAEWRLNIAVGNANSITYAVDVHLLI